MLTTSHDRRLPIVVLPCSPWLLAFHSRADSYSSLPQTTTTFLAVGWDGSDPSSYVWLHAVRDMGARRVMLRLLLSALGVRWCSSSADVPLGHGAGGNIFRWGRLCGVTTQDSESSVGARRCRRHDRFVPHLYDCTKPNCGLRVKR